MAAAVQGDASIVMASRLHRRKARSTVTGTAFVAWTETSDTETCTAGGARSVSVGPAMLMFEHGATAPEEFALSVISGGSDRLPTVPVAAYPPSLVGVKPWMSSAGLPDANAGRSNQSTVPQASNFAMMPSAHSPPSIR